MGKKNYDKSVKTRLLNLMNETGYKYMYLLARYFNERLLYRVSFDAGSIKIEPITVEKKYPGTRFYFTAHLADRTRRL